MKHNVSKGKVDSIDFIVSSNLKLRRILLGYNQQELGRVVSVSVQQIQKYENGINRIPSGKLYNFAKFLNTPIDYFFTMNHNLGCAIETSKNASKLSTHRVCLSLLKACSNINESNQKKLLKLIKIML